MSLSARKFQTLLLNWFKLNGRHDLPWQQNKTAYRVFVSEIMLQQTQVKTVIPYFNRFMQRFPNVSTLAEANLDEVLHLWAGLGYYSRARNLHAAAKMIMSEYGGQFPCEEEAVLALPGIGKSTAAAILSIAFNQSIPILDGNVKRVFARLHGMTDPINDKATENQLWQIAKHYMPKTHCADFTQAIMDFGATFCKRGKPNCSACPFTTDCIAYQKNIAEILPIKKLAKKLSVRVATFLLIKNGENVFLEKRNAKGIWGGLWSVPELTGIAEISEINTYVKKHFKVSPTTKILTLPSMRHTFTHYHLEIHPVLIHLPIRPKTLADAKQIWYNPKKPSLIGLPKPVATIIKEVL